MTFIRNGTRYRRLIEPFEQMYLAGLSTRDIARLLNVSSSKVAKHIKDLAVSREREKARQTAQPDRVHGYMGSSTHWRTTRQHARKTYTAHHGTELKANEHVHHKDGDYTNNAIDNLQVLDPTTHAHIHHPPNPIPRHKRPKREAYMRAYLKTYRKGKP